MPISSDINTMRKRLEILIKVFQWARSSRSMSRLNGRNCSDESDPTNTTISE